MHREPYWHLFGLMMKFLQIDVKYYLFSPFLRCSSCSPWANPQPYPLVEFSHLRPLSQNLQNSVLTLRFQSSVGLFSLGWPFTFFAFFAGFSCSEFYS